MEEDVLFARFIVTDKTRQLESEERTLVWLSKNYDNIFQLCYIKFILTLFD